jgi:hypothetical protein
MHIKSRVPESERIEPAHRKKNTSGLKMWKKGCPPPNPAGRPRTKWFSDAAKAILAEPHPRTQKSGAERLMELAFRRALQGSYKHLQLLVAYAEGTPTHSVNVSGSLLHGHTVYRDPKLAKLTEEELKQLDVLTRKLLAPEAQTADGKTLEVAAEAFEEL